MALTRAQSTTSTLRDLTALTRPGVMTLVLLTGPAGFVLGRPHWPSAVVVVGTIAATALLAGGCSAFNAVYEHERDARMARTRNRPLPSGRVSPATACWFASATTAAGLAGLYAVGGPLPTLVGGITWVWYVGVYTMWLKPRTPQSIVIGGAAGATAPLIADAAAYGELGVWSWVLALLVFTWTPSHFWAIALFRREDYANAGFPMMPAVVGPQPTRWRMLAYAVATVAVSLAPVWAGELGLLYGAVAIGLGLWFVGLHVAALRQQSRKADRGIFVGSVVYLAVLFAVMTVAA